MGTRGITAGASDRQPTLAEHRWLIYHGHPRQPPTSLVPPSLMNVIISSLACEESDQEPEHIGRIPNQRVVDVLPRSSWRHPEREIPRSWSRKSYAFRLPFGNRLSYF